MSDVHAVVGFAVVSIFAIGWLWPLAALVVRRRPGDRYWIWLTVAQVTAGLQALLGLVLLLIGRRPPSGDWLHLVYGFGPLVILAMGEMLPGSPLASLAHGPYMGWLGLLLASEKTGFLPGAGGGRGTLCLKAPVARFSASAAVSSAAGTFGWDVDLSAVPGFGQVLPGQTWHFQVWYRDDDPGPTSNLSDAASVLFH